MLGEMEPFIERQINAFLWLSLIGVTAFLLGKLLKIFRLWYKARSLPGPRCPSFYGHYQLISSSNLIDVLYKSHKGYGKIIKLWLGPSQLMVSISDTQLIKEVLLKAEDKYPLAGGVFHASFGRPSLFVSSFDKVEDQRKSLEVKLSSILLRKTSLISSKKIVDFIVERIQNVDVNGGLDSENISQHLAFTIMGASLFGEDFLTWPKANIYEELLTRISRDACYWESHAIIPFWKQEFWKYQHQCHMLKCLTLELVDQCKQNQKADSVIYYDPNTSFGSYGETISLLFHGTRAMAALVGNTISSLVMHPEIQTKIRAEISMSRNVKEEETMSIDGLPHLLATVYESSRLLPFVPLLQRCSLRHDLQLTNGMTIPAGVILILPIQLVQMENTNWGMEADKFDPHRFLSVDDRCDSVPKKFLSGCSSCIMKDLNEFEAFLPFGFGARACLGQKLAILGILSLFVAILERFEIIPLPESESIPKQHAKDSIIQHRPNHKIVFTQRIT